MKQMLVVALSATITLGLAAILYHISSKAPTECADKIFIGGEYECLKDIKEHKRRY